MSEYDCYCSEDEEEDGLVELIPPQTPRPYRTTRVHTTSSTIIEPAESEGDIECYCDDDQVGGELVTPPDQQMRAPPTSLCIDSLLSVYYAHIHSHMSYGLLFWGNHGMASRVFKLQKRAIRTISGDSQSHCRPLFAKYRILTLYSMGIRRVTRQTVTSSTTLIPEPESTYRSRDVLSRARAGLGAPPRGKKITPPREKFPWLQKEQRRQVSMAPVIQDENEYPTHLNLPGPRTEEWRPRIRCRRSPAPPLAPRPRREKFQVYGPKPETPQDIRNQIFSQRAQYATPDFSQSQAPDWGSGISGGSRPRCSRRRTMSESDALEFSPIPGPGGRVPGWSPPEGMPTPKPYPRTIRTPCPVYGTPDPAWHNIRTPPNATPPAVRRIPGAERARQRLFCTPNSSAAPVPKLRMDDLDESGVEEIECPAQRVLCPVDENTSMNQSVCYRPSPRSPSPRRHSQPSARRASYSGDSPSPGCQGCCNRGCCNISH
ncbi:hypothetical protein C0J52_01381 [Blattella germanica]|nr:hypothetical protein C0J52_01381 [Blattella germanica]